MVVWWDEYYIVGLFEVELHIELCLVGFMNIGTIALFLPFN